MKDPCGAISSLQSQTPEPKAALLSQSFPASAGEEWAARRWDGLGDGSLDELVFPGMEQKCRAMA